MRSAEAGYGETLAGVSPQIIGPSATTLESAGTPWISSSTGFDDVMCLLYSELAVSLACWSGRTTGRNAMYLVAVC